MVPKYVLYLYNANEFGLLTQTLALVINIQNQKICENKCFIKVLKEYIFTFVVYTIYIDYGSIVVVPEYHIDTFFLV